MDPKEQRPRSPSLLAGEGDGALPAASQERMLAGLKEPATPPAPRRRRWLWPVSLVLAVAVALLLLDLGGAFDGAGSKVATRASGMGSGAADNSDAVPVAANVASHTAVILSDSPEAAVAASAPAPTASVGKDAAALSAVFAPPVEPRKPGVAPRPRVRHAGRDTGDSDVTLLTALIQHVEVESPTARKAARAARHEAPRTDQPLDSIEARMQACPAANTEAGLRCRQRICAGHAGETAACPAATDGA